ncbi:MAG: hypothetical protein CM15mP74_18450 [Halieaceae bacterium]|nr:MAG: hypothetical protein CM15mP74_18450 [Halieaceae bacterium]
MVSLLGVCLLCLSRWGYHPIVRLFGSERFYWPLACRAALGLWRLDRLGYCRPCAASEYVAALLGYSRAGMEFMFGGLVGTSDSLGFVFAFNVLPVVIFFSSLIAVLYHARVMQWMIRILGGGLRKLLGTSHTESLSAAANVFVGQAEAPLVARPYISSMTQSELFA